MTGPQASGDEDEGGMEESVPSAPTSKLAVSSLPGLKSDEVRNRGFKRATRGVSEAEVRNFLHRVGEELDAGQARERALQHRIDQLEDQAANPPPVTEESLLDALGEETARVLRTAQDAARHIRSTAEEQGAAVVAEAEARARALREEVDAFVAERRKESQANADRVRADAEETVKQLLADAGAQASEIREVAETEAQAAASAALEQARAMVAEAKAVRERVLTDLGQRRRVLQAQIEELRGGRDRLLQGYQVVRRTLADATKALGGAEPEPDLDLEAIVSDEPEREDPELERLLEEVVRDGEGPDTSAEGPDTSAEGPDTSAEGPDTSAGEPNVSAEDIVEDSGVSGANDVAATPDEEAVPQGSGLRRYVKGALGLGSTAGGNDAPGDEVAGEEVVGELVAEEAVAEEGARGDARKPDPESVFAKLRSADRSDAPDDRVKGTDESGDTKGENVNEGVDAEPVELTGDAALLAARDELLGPVEAALARVIKREAQNDQNELLDALRRAKRRKDLSPLLPERSDMADAWGAAAAEPLSTAYGADVPSKLGVELASTLVGSLHERLADAIAEGGDNEALTQRVGARYREWRSQDLVSSVAEVTATAHTRGVFDRADSGSTLRWVAARPGRCPDCDDNALESTRRGDAFPTGQAFPPAHPGCRCLLVVGS